MLIIEGKNLWFDLVYDGFISEGEFLESLEAFYVYAKQNSRQVTKLVNEYGDGDHSRHWAINLSSLGF